MPGQLADEQLNFCPDSGQEGITLIFETSYTV